MTGKQYIETQRVLIEVAKTLEGLDLDGFLKSVANAETMAPVLDPTLYRKAGANLAAVKKLAEAALAVKDVFTEVRNTVIKTAVAVSFVDRAQPPEDDL